MKARRLLWPAVMGLLAAALAQGTWAAADADASPPQAAPVQTAPAAAESLPAALQGEWEPVSRALESAGNLTLQAQSLIWLPCGAAAHAMQVQEQADGTGHLLKLVGQPACQLDGTPVSHLRVQRSAKQACDLEVAVFASDKQLAKGERLAWGVYTQASCPEGGAPGTAGGR